MACETKQWIILDKLIDQGWGLQSGMLCWWAGEAFSKRVITAVKANGMVETLSMHDGSYLQAINAMLIPCSVLEDCYRLIDSGYKIKEAVNIVIWKNKL